MKYRFRSQTLFKIFKELKKNHVCRIIKPHKNVIKALRSLEKELSKFGYDFSVHYDSYRKELLVFSSSVKTVSNSEVKFEKFI